MTPDARLALGTHGVLRAACLMAVLVGIFGMHGLADHGVSGTDLMPHSVMSQAYAGMNDMDAFESAAMRTGGPAVISQGASSAFGEGNVVSMGPSQDGMDLNMTGLCLAILIIGFGTLSLWLARRRTPRPAWVSPHAARAVERSGRHADPPSLQVLSIRRC